MFSALLVTSLCFTNEEVSKTYVYQGGLMSVVLKISAINTQTTPMKEYILNLPTREAKCVTSITASHNDKIRFNPTESLPIKKLADDQFAISLLQACPAGQSMELVISYSLTDYLLFLKKKIVLNEKYPLYFNASTHFLSQYSTKKYNIKIEGIQKSSITSISQIPTLQQKSLTMTIGPFDHDEGDFEIEFQSPVPSILYHTVFTTTSVSHWGKTKQRSFIDVRNNGPIFSGEFNRIDYNSNTPCQFQSVSIKPSTSFYSVWARDESGLLQNDIPVSEKSIQIPLRGPVLTSWKATFTAGWTTETSEFVTDKYVFRSPLFPQLTQGSVDNVTSVFLLPEGAVIHDISVPISANVEKITKMSNLDIKGRTAVRIEAHRISTKDNIEIIIKYDVSDSWGLSKPAVLSGGLAIILLAIVILRRIDFSLDSAEVARKTKIE